MGRFDNIDIFFIAIIGAYFITLACILLSLVIIGIRKLIRNRKLSKELKPVLPVIEDTIKIPIIEEPKAKKAKKSKEIKENKPITKPKKEIKKEKIKEVIPRESHRKLRDIAIIQKLFMKKVTPTTKNIEINTDKEPVVNNIDPKEIKKPKLETSILNDKVHVNTSKYDTQNTLEKQKSDLEQVIEQINKTDNNELLNEKQVKEKELNEEVINIVIKESKESNKSNIKPKEATKDIKTETKDKKEPIVKTASGVKEEKIIPNETNVKEDAPKVENEKSKKTTSTKKNTSNSKNSKKSSNSKTSNNKKSSNNNSKKGSKGNSKKKKNNNHKKKTSNSKGKKNTKKKTVKRKKS